MKLQPLLVSLLASGAFAQTVTEDDYEDLCGEKDGSKDTILPGYTYTCNTLGPHSGEPVAGIASAEDCAGLCQNRRGCTGSSWSVRDSTCSVGTGAGDSGSTRQGWTLYMKNLTPPPAEEPSEGGSQAGASVCNRLRDQCLQEMQNSQCSCTGNGGAGGGNSGGTGEDNGSGGDGGLGQTGGDPNKQSHYGSALSGWSEKKVDTVEECIQGCNDYPDQKCKRAMWWVSGERFGCTLKGWGTSTAPTTEQVCEPNYPRKGTNTAVVAPCPPV
ncbi:unnamed protein product [Penicillium bialowiezense]